jgi:hypothetical protein
MYRYFDVIEIFFLHNRIWEVNLVSKQGPHFAGPAPAHPVKRWDQRRRPGPEEQWGALKEAAFTCHTYPKYFLFHSSHRIFRRMHEVLNVGKKITNCIVCL